MNPALRNRGSLRSKRGEELGDQLQEHPHRPGEHPPPSTAMHRHTWLLILPRRSCCARAPATLCRGMRREVRRGVCLCSSRYARSSRWAELVAARERRAHLSSCFLLSTKHAGNINTTSQRSWDEASLISHSLE